MKGLVVLLFPCAAFAQVYTWKEGDSTRISTQPPAWYRVDGPSRAPHVVVTQGRRVLDDTRLPMEERLRMRPRLHPVIPADPHPFLNGTKVQ